MHGLGAGADGGVDDRVDVEIALPGRRRADPDRHIGFGDVPGAGIGVAVDGHRTDTHRLERSDDPDCDLAAVCHQNGVEECCVHGSLHPEDAVGDRFDWRSRTH